MRNTLPCAPALLFLCTIGLCVVGCGRGHKQVAEKPANVESFATSEKVAVIDINEVARQIGAMDKIRKSMAEFEAQLKTKLDGFKNELDLQYQDEQARRNEDLNNHNSGELEDLLAKHQQAIGQQALLAENQLANHHNQLKLKLINQIRPIAFDIAKEQGMAMVLTTSQIYAAGPEADITKAVADRINKMNSSQEKTDDQIPRVANLPGGGEFKPF